MVSLGLPRWQRAEQGRRGGLGVMPARVHGHSLEGREKKGWIRKMWVPSCYPIIFCTLTLSESAFRWVPVFSKQKGLLLTKALLCTGLWTDCGLFLTSF